MSLIKRCFGNLSSMMINDGLKVFEEFCKLLSFRLPKKKEKKGKYFNKADKVFKYFCVHSFPEKEVIVSTAPYSKV